MRSHARCVYVDLGCMSMISEICRLHPMHMSSSFSSHIPIHGDDISVKVNSFRVVHRMTCEVVLALHRYM